MSVFEEVKDKVTTIEAFRHYGIDVGSKGMCCCIFHNDKHPSMKVDRRYHCFGCGADGDVIDFVSNYYGLSAIPGWNRISSHNFWNYGKQRGWDREGTPPEIENPDGFVAVTEAMGCPFT